MSTNVKVSVRVSPRLLELADTEVSFLGEDLGHDVSRADVLRRALAIGLKSLSARRQRAADGTPPEDDTPAADADEAPHG